MPTFSLGNHVELDNQTSLAVSRPLPKLEESIVLIGVKDGHEPNPQCR